MVKKGDAYAVGSQDFDCLLFGSPVLVRNLTSSEKRKLPNKQAYTTVHIERISLSRGLSHLGISQEQLVDAAILIGTDFNDGVKGYGPKKSLQLIKKAGNVEHALTTINGLNIPSFEEIKEIRDIFLSPETTEDYTLTWSTPNKDTVVNILCDQHQFSQDRVASVVEKFSVIEHIKKQKNLFEF
jgi:flap endonuclease-1